jgi:hypothetical protein
LGWYHTVPPPPSHGRVCPASFLAFVVHSVNIDKTSETCNRVNCGKCKKNFCWICLELTGHENASRELKYSHWAGKNKNKCPLWKGERRVKQQPPAAAAGAGAGAAAAGGGAAAAAVAPREAAAVAAAGVGAPRAGQQPAALAVDDEIVPRRMPAAGGAVAERVAAIAAAAAARVQQQRPAVAAPAVAKR